VAKDKDRKNNDRLAVGRIPNALVLVAAKLAARLSRNAILIILSVVIVKLVVFLASNLGMR